MPLGSTSDLFAYYVVILIMPSCILFNDRTPPPYAGSFWHLVVSPALLKSFPLDLEEIVIGHFDVEGDSMKRVKRVIHNTSII
jgi:hypothetical protein